MSKIVDGIVSHIGDTDTEVLVLSPAKVKPRNRAPTWPRAGDVVVHLFVAEDSDDFDGSIEANLYEIESVAWSDEDSDYMVDVDDGREPCAGFDGRVNDGENWVSCYSKPRNAVRNLDRLFKKTPVKQRKLLAGPYQRVRECLQRSFS